MRRRILILISLVALVVGLTPVPSFAARGDQSAPKLLNLYLGWQIRTDDQAALAKWDVVVLDMDQQWQSPDKMRALKLANPRIKLLAYISAGELSTARAQGDHTSPGYRLSQLAPETLFMHSSSGQRLSWWPSAQLMNATDVGPVSNGRRWNDVLPAFVRDEMMSTGLWDGVFLDAAYSDVTSFFGKDIDPEGDGTADTPTQINALWRTGMSHLLTKMRSAIGSDKIILVNSSSAYANQVNGVLFENFPRYGWSVPLKEMRDAMAKNVAPSVTAINTNTNDQDQPASYRLMRYGLGSALLTGGFYSFDAGASGHDRTWWYDEYDTPLGTPKSASRLVVGSGVQFTPGVWLREYQKGIVLVNSDSVPHTVNLPGTFEKLHGAQDPKTNDGSLVRSVNLASQDGVILLGQSTAVDVRNAAYVNGSFVRVYTGDGAQERTGFFAQRGGAPSGALVDLVDLAHNGNESLVSANAGVLSISPASGGAVTTLRPFGTGYRGRMSLAVGNTNGDAASEIIVGRDGSAPPEVRVLSASGKLLAHWNAYISKFTGGVRVAIGDLDGNGTREIVTGAGPGGGPHIRIFKTDGQVWGGSFFAFNQSERGGVSVAVGDVDRDGKDEIVVGSGEGAIPRVRIFDFRGTLKREFTLGTQPLLNGVTVSVADLNGNGAKEILVGGVSPF